MPTTRTVAAAAGYAALAATDSYLAGRGTVGARRARRLTKPLLMPVLAAAFGEATRDRSGVLTRSVQAAQAFSWGGDLALLGSGERSFLTGVGSFAGAHVAYITGFGARRDRSAHRDTAGIKAAAALCATAAPLMGLAAARRSAELSVPVAGYATILATMFGTSTILEPAIPTTSRNLIKAGTALFLLSDSLLGVQKFVLREQHPALESAVMATYTAGQGLIAAGAAGAARGA